MGIGKKVVLILVTTITGINLMACNKTSNDKISTKETNYYSTTIDGKKKYYAEDDLDIVGIKELADNLLNAYANVDYKNEDYLKEFDYYTKEQQEINEMYDAKTVIKDFMVAGEVVMKLNNYDVKSIEFYNLKGKESATVIIDYSSTLTNATKEYLEENQTQLNKQLNRSMNLMAEKEDAQWKITLYSIQYLED